MASQRRPEHVAPPDIFYNTTEASKYASNTRMIDVQTRMAQRAIDLLALSRPSYVLDIGCGSGLSGEVLSQSNHVWTGTDIAPAMLGVAVSREVEGDVMCSDMGQGLPFRPGTFDAAISISAVQWLCNADQKSHIPQKRLKVFFESLYRCLVRGARAVLQVYPESAQQMTLITNAAMRAGFSGGIVVDFPNSTRAKKMFLVLFAGGGGAESLPSGLSEEHETSMLPGVQFVESSPFDNNASRRRRKDRQKRVPIKSREWILKKKERRERQGKKTARASKYAGRKRRDKF